MLSARPAGAHGASRGRTGPAGDALAAGVGHRRAWRGGDGGARPPGEAGDDAAPTTTAFGGPGCCSGGAGTGQGPPPAARGWEGAGYDGAVTGRGRRRGCGGEGDRRRREEGDAGRAGERKG
ncbi:virulence-associated membrane protein 2-like [Miscanthus floridulus]|uniref:virulence-associated membrane protein 2-like n=1 Tax=Miscanthus floridulus TaxID=154761 RepID=UPI00345770F6